MSATSYSSHIGQTALHLDHVSFSYGQKQILTDVCFDVRFGEVVGILGPNGAGKSTLVGLMSADLQPTHGKVKYQGKEASSLSKGDLARIRSVMPQSCEFPFAYRVRDLVMMGRHCWERNPHEDEAIIEESMRMTDVAQFRDRDVTRLSGGEKARVTFARVLAQQAGVIFLDEPTAALDIAHQERTMEICRALAERGHAVIAVMHDLQLAGAYCDRIALMDKGTIAAYESPNRVLTSELLTRVYQWPIDVVSVEGGRIVALPRQRAFYR